MYLYLTDHVPCQTVCTFFRLSHTPLIRPRLASIVVHSMQEVNRLRAFHPLVLNVFAIISYF